MYDIELRIKARDWAYILLIGVMFGSVLSAMGYWLLGNAWTDGALFGLLTGFSITLLSLAFITFMNQKILPNVEKRYWLALAVLFSFVSGFTGTMISVEIAWYSGIRLLEPVHDNLLGFSTGIGVLTYIVGALLYLFVRMRNEKEEVDRHYTDSRLRSLDTQLNPHFLFNALNSLAELVHQDSEKAEDAILKLSAFLRNTMNEKALTTLGEELDNVSAYIELENIRFGDRIRLVVGSDIPKWQIPKFSVQLLAENAIKHGMKERGATLTVAVDFDRDARRVIVTNDGAAMPETRRGIGLSNLDERLRLLCGGKLTIAGVSPPTIYLDIGACHENPDR